jgi:hypothetical protein
MITAIVVLVVSVILFVKYPPRFGFLSGLVGVLFAFVVWLLLAGVVGLIVEQVDGSTFTKTTPIVSLSEDTHVTGKFSLGYGSVNSVPSYHYFVQIDEDSFAKHWVPADRTVITEDASMETAKLVEIGNAEPPSLWFWGVAPNGEEPDSSYEIHVPAGTIVQEMQVR